MSLNRLQIEPLVKAALSEDLSLGDMTTDAFAEFDVWVEAEIRTRQACTVSGMEVARLAFQLLDERVTFTVLVESGQQADKGQLLAAVCGPVSALLKAERTALNFLQHLSGIATETHRYTAVLKGTGARLTDTRKTTPGLRVLEKQAVVDGGGSPHRFNLGCAVMLKDNHLECLQKQKVSLAETVARLRQKISHTATIEVEVETLEALNEALEVGADIVLLDNMSVEMVSEAVRRIGDRAVIEVSGGITLDTLGAYAGTGVQYISTSKITLGAPSVDIGLDILTVGKNANSPLPA